MQAKPEKDDLQRAGEVIIILSMREPVFTSAYRLVKHDKEEIESYKETNQEDEEN